MERARERKTVVDNYVFTEFLVYQRFKAGKEGGARVTDTNGFRDRSKSAAAAAKKRKLDRV